VGALEHFVGIVFFKEIGKMGEDDRDRVLAVWRSGVFEGFFGGYFLLEM
jgi:hypothetical protein